MRNVRMVAIILFCAIAVLGCDNYSYKQDASKSEIIGIWDITDSSLHRLRKAGYTKYIKKNEHKIVFFEDDTCTISTYLRPLSHPNLQQQEETYLNAEDRTWEITSKNGFTGLAGQISPVPAIEMKYEFIEKDGNHTVINRKSSYLYISKKHDINFLWYYIGDPDSNDCIEFIRVK